ncbi:MAG TPA: 2-oxo acid dehydrogenase subunit E2 [Solirubrobacteraceae bacterium]
MRTEALKGETTVLEPTRAERAIARRNAETRATVPDLELGTEVEIEPALAAAGASLTAVLVRACALALRDHPRANAAYRDGHYELYSRVNVAVTVMTDDGHASPTLIDADTKPLADLSSELAALTERARAGELTGPDLAGATFTLTDLGEWGLTRPGTLVTPPQAAALAAGGVRDVPVVRDGAVVPGRVLALTLACDSRILFGAHAAAFLAAVCCRLRTATS